jgi:FkbM family methyltransferase
MFRPFGFALDALRSFLTKSIYPAVLPRRLRLPKLSIVESESIIVSGLSKDYGFREVAKNGISEPHFLEVIQVLLNEESICIDAGANIGGHAIAMSKVATNGLIYAFEPQSLTFSILQNNIILNGCKNIIPYRFAVSSRDHEVISMCYFSFSNKKTNNGNLSIDQSGLMKGDLALTRTLDGFNFELVDFIKFDIQGAEVLALSGAKALIKRCKPILFVEIEERHLRKLGASTKILIELILSMEYAIYRVESTYPCDHLCIPNEKIDEFESAFMPKMKVRLSPRISGESVTLTFASSRDQTYETISVT